MSHPPHVRRPLRTALGTGLVAVATSLAAWFSPLPADAAEGDTEVDVEGLADPILINGDGLVVVPSGNVSGVQAASQCFDGSSSPTDPTKACLGIATSTEQPPLDIGGRGALYSLIKAGPEAEAALGPVAVQAAQDVRVTYDLPNDARIPAYARPEIRAAMVDTLVHIMDKKVYGVALTADEQRALTWLEQQYLDRDRFLARKASAELDIFNASPCSYTPPVAPPSVTKPTTVPSDVTEWCRTHVGMLATASTIAMPLPSPAQFSTWASYRYADELGLTAFADPVVQKNLVSAAIASATLGGFAVAAAAGGGAYYLATATSLASSIAAKLFPHLVKPIWESSGWITKLVGRMLAEQAGAWAGAVSAAVIAAVTIVALVVIGVATYLVVKHASIAASLKATVDATEKATDPFGLDPLTEKLSGKPLNSVIFTEPPEYRKDAAYSKLASLIVLWTTAQKNVSPGGNVSWEAVPDRDGVWSDSTPTDADPKWVVRVGSKDPVVTDTVRIPQSNKDARVYPAVSLSRGWLVVRQADRPPRAALSIGYLDENGDARLAQRAPSGVGGFIVSNPKKGVSGENVRELTFRNAGGELVRVRLQRRATTFVAGPRPTAVGPLWTGRPVLLRPNPVGTNGASLDPAEVEEDYDFDWTVEHLDAETGEWSPVHTASGFGTRFDPTTPGEYDARVTMTTIGDPSQKKYGAVRFTVNPPPVTAPVVQLQDDGESRVELDLQLQEEVPSDAMHVEVTWPGALGSDDNPVTTLDLPCIQTGPLECTTQRTGPSNLLVRTLDNDADLRRPVRLTVTNSTGGVYQRELQLGAGRPSTAPPPAGANGGEPGTAVLDPSGGVQVEMPLAYPTESQDYTVARLVPVAGGLQDFNLLDPDTGNTVADVELPGSDGLFGSVFEEGGDWYLSVHGIPEPEDLGTYSVPLVVGQTNSTRTVVPVTVHVVPSTGDRYRGGLLTDLDPDDNGTATPPDLEPAVLGGKAADPAYKGSLCISLQYRDFGAAPVVQCRNVADYVGADGVARPFPYAELFPKGMRSGSYQASAWLATPGDNVDTDPLTVGYFLLEDASYPPPKVSLGAVTVSGRARVGKTLRAGVAAVYPSSAGLTYTWLRDGKAIKDATSASYVLKRADKGHRIAVKVVAKLKDWTSTTKTSAKTTVVR